MELINTLERAGYDVTLKRDGAVEIVEAHRTPRVKLGRETQNEMYLELSRHQDEAIAWLRTRNAPQQIVSSPLIEAWTIPAANADELAKQIMSNTLSPHDEAIAICQYCIAMGDVTTSDGLLWVEVLRDLMESK